MDIGEAVKAMKEGKKVRRQICESGLYIYKEGYPNYINDKIISIYDSGNSIIQNFVSVFTVEDILADDWEIID